MCVCFVKGYSLGQKLVFKAGIKAFCYTKYFFFSVLEPDLKMFDYDPEEFRSFNEN